MECKYSKKSQHFCPNCGSDNVDWGKIESDSNPYFDAFCEDCGCNFQEVYEYSITYYDKITSSNQLSEEEIENALNSENENWPEFEVIKDCFVSFMEDLPIEIYEHLFKVINQNPNKLVQYLLDYKD